MGVMSPVANLVVLVENHCFQVGVVADFDFVFAPNPHEGGGGSHRCRCLENEQGRHQAKLKRNENMLQKQMKR